MLDVMKIKKGDNVQIMVGKDSGKSGKISEVDIKSEKIMISGLNVFKKNKKPTKQGEKGQVISISRFIPVSNVQLLCKSCGKPSRIGYKVEDSKKVRVCKKCEVII
mgnify:CR=1 FL=1